MNATTAQRERRGALHVFKRDERWWLMRHGDAQVSVFRTQAEAVRSGARIARAESGVLVIYDQDGGVQATRRYDESRGPGTHHTDERLQGSR